jgi:hypothetical protein
MTKSKFEYEKAARERAWKQRNMDGFSGLCFRAKKGDQEPLCDYLLSDKPLTERDRSNLAYFIYTWGRPLGESRAIYRGPEYVAYLMVVEWRKQWLKENPGRKRVTRSKQHMGGWLDDQIKMAIREVERRRPETKVRIPANADSDSDRLRTAIPIDRGQRSGDRGQRLPSTALRAHSALSVSSFPRLPEFSGGLRRVSPSRARRCAVWTRRSRTASAIVGSTITSCQ